MKTISTILLVSLSTCLFISAHEGHKNAPKGHAFTKVVRTGQNAFIYETAPGFGEIPNGAKLGPTHGGVAVDKNGLIYTSTDAEQSIPELKPDSTFLKP
ncbi:MAG TPA: hypothetical protein DHV60_00895, partial [Verrucomicrobiales bacterium]|nr:hypothetical protein [Verrucomicrobiales bacterium]